MCGAELPRMLAAPVASIGAPIRQHLQSLRLNVMERSSRRSADSLPCSATGGGGNSPRDKGPPGGSGGGGDGSGDEDNDDELLSKKQACTGCHHHRSYSCCANAFNIGRVKGSHALQIRKAPLCVDQASFLTAGEFRMYGSQAGMCAEIRGETRRASHKQNILQELLTQAVHVLDRRRSWLQPRAWSCRRIFWRRRPGRACGSVRCRRIWPSRAPCLGAGFRACSPPSATASLLTRGFSSKCAPPPPAQFFLIDMTPRQCFPARGLFATACHSSKA